MTGLPGMSPAQMLRTVAGLMEDGCPKPIGVTLPSHGYPGVVHLAADDVPAWGIALDVVEPTWETAVHDGHAPSMWFARWPEGEFDKVPFTLASLKIDGERVSSDA